MYSRPVAPLRTTVLTITFDQFLHVTSFGNSRLFRDHRKNETRKIIPAFNTL